MTSPGDPFAAVSTLRKSGKNAEALAALRDLLRCDALDAEGVDKAGRLIRKLRPEGTKTLDVRLLGQCTTTWLGASLTAVGFAQGIDLAVGEAGFDNVIQDLAATRPDAAPEIAVLLPWTTRLFGGSSPDEELSFWRQSWDLAAKAGMKIVQVGYDWVVPDALGYSLGRRDGAVAKVRELNQGLAQALPPGAFFVDLEQISGVIGRDSFYDMRRYYWTKQPFSEVGTKTLAGHLFAAIRAVTTGPKKVLVLDLDNTLWGGVVGEAGPHGIVLGESADGEAFRAFQRHCQALSKRGVLLALASKNNPADAHEPFHVNPDMVLKLDDFAAAEIGWEPKGTTIARLAETLNLGIDSFVFFDDNPAEREQVRQAQPEVAVVDVPADPSEYVRVLQRGLWFEAVSLTGEDLVRVEQYAVERKRRELQGSFRSMDDYFRSLEMIADVREIDEADLSRVVQLLGKTNQFNLTTRRHSREDVLELLGRDRSFGITLRMADKFGDHGLVGLVIAVPNEGQPDTLRIDTWLMSCRVIARTVEQFQFREIHRRAEALGYRHILGEFLPTAKNSLVAELYPSLGLRAVEGNGPDVLRYALEVGEASLPQTFVNGVREK